MTLRRHYGALQHSFTKAKNRIVEHFQDSRSSPFPGPGSAKQATPPPQELAAEADYLALWLDCDQEVRGVAHGAAVEG